MRLYLPRPHDKKAGPANQKKINRARINRKTSSNKYICLWCSKRYDSIFIKKRVGDNLTDKKVLVASARLVKWDEPEGDTEDDFKVLSDFDWYEYYKEGKEFGRGWEEYYIVYTGVLTWEREDHTEKMNISAPLWFIWHPEDPTKLIWIIQIRIFYKQSLAFAEILLSDPANVKESIQNTQKIDTKDELEKVWKGFQLFRKLKKNSGRPPKFYDAEDFKKGLRAAYEDLYKLYPVNLYPTKLDIAATMGISQAAFYSACKKFNLDLDQYLLEIKPEIEAKSKK